MQGAYVCLIAGWLAGDGNKKPGRNVRCDVKSVGGESRPYSGESVSINNLTG